MCVYTATEPIANRGDTQLYPLKARRLLVPTQRLRSADAGQVLFALEAYAGQYTYTVNQ